MLFSIVDTFRNGIRYFVGFTKSITHNTISIANHDDRREAEPASTLHNLGYPFDGNDSFLLPVSAY